jgi:hypothetical protein
MKPREQRCETCRYFDGQRMSYRCCRINPPTMPNPCDQLGVWPVVQSNDWCGAWKPKERQVNEGGAA